MEKELVFHILGIEETKEEGVIRTSYMNLLKSTNPEDDPDGFKRLREAYETALKLAREEVHTLGETVEEGEVEVWISRIGKVYENMDLRYRLNEWKELLSDPVCDGLDTSVEAREQMLRFLMDHIYLPHDVWKLIDKTFDIVAGIPELKERFPGNFLDYVKFYIENDSFIQYHLFQVRDPEKQNGDKYLEHYFAVKRKLDQGESSGCLEELSDLSAFGVYYPYEDVERIRFYLQSEQYEDACQQAESLLDRYPSDNYIRAWSGEALYRVGRKEEANELWLEVLKEAPDYYQARIGSIRYLMETGDYYEAHEKLQDVLDHNNQDKEAADMLTECNNRLIEEYQRKLANGEEDTRLSRRDMRIELGWSLFQSERVEEAIQLMEDFSPDEKSEYDFYNLFGRLLHHDKQYERAKPYLEKWVSLLLTTVDDGTEKMQRRISRKCRGLNILGSCCYELKDPEKAEEYLRQGIEVAPNTGEKLGTMSYLSHILSQSKQYEKAIDICDEILREDEKYFPAYLTRQESAYELKRGQTVIDDYYKAISIYPNYYKPYLLAAQVFFYYSQYEDGKGVLDRARENKVEFSNRMKLYEVKILRNLARSNEDRKEPHRIIDELLKAGDDESDIEDRSEVIFEKGLLEWDDERYQEALRCLEQAIRMNPERLQYRMVRGNIYLDMKRYMDAVKEYKEAEPAYDDGPGLYYNLGLCYEGLEMNNLAIENFRKTLTMQKPYRHACGKLADYHKSLYEENCKEEEIDTALEYITMELEARESSYYFIERGLIYEKAYRLREAIADYEKALELEPDSLWAYNNMGCCYQYLGEIEKALECFTKSAELMKEKESIRPYANMANCHKIMEQFGEAIACYKKNLELFPERTTYWEDIGDLYTIMEDYNQAIAAYGHIKDHDNYYCSLGLLHERQDKKLKAFWYYLRGIMKAVDSNRAKRWENLADFFGTDHLILAGWAYKRAIAHSKTPHQRFNRNGYLGRLYYRAGQKDQAKRYAGYAMEAFAAEGITEEDYLNYHRFTPARLAGLGWIYIMLGDTAKGEEYFERMDQILRCAQCKHKVCYEKYYFRGLYREANGDYAGAMADYQEMHKYDSRERTAEKQINKLRKKMERQK